MEQAKSKSLFEMQYRAERQAVLRTAIENLIPGEDTLAMLMARAAHIVFDTWNAAKDELAEGNE